MTSAALQLSQAKRSSPPKTNAYGRSLTVSSRPPRAATTSLPRSPEWWAGPARAKGHELVAAGLHLLAGRVDGDQLEAAVRVGYERGKGSLQGYDSRGLAGTCAAWRSGFP
jgi:hypothetical protein